MTASMGLRIAFAEGLMFEALDAEVERAVRACGAVFDGLGARVSQVDFDVAPRRSWRVPA
jgi:hypothetical protein